MLLSSEVDSANFMIPRGIALLSKGPLAKHQDIHQICTYFRQRGVASLLMEGSPDAYFVNAMQSASAYAMELRCAPDEAKVGSFFRPLQDAVSIGDWDHARRSDREQRTDCLDHRPHKLGRRLPG